ncbi:MAG: hypothetical protein ABIH00_09095 [Armatimonadota bacterium]
MARFHKNGIMILKNKKGEYYVFEADSKLSDVAKYIWKDETFSGYFVKPDEKEDKRHKVHFIDFKKELSPRLRSFTDIMDDTYYEEAR